MTPTQLADALTRLFPNVRRAILLQLAAWQRSGGASSRDALIEAVRRGDAERAASVVLGSTAQAGSAGPTDLPDAARAFGEAIGRIPAAAPASAPAQGVIRTVAETVLEAQRLSLTLMPSIPMPAFRDAPTPLPPRTPAVISRDMRAVARAVGYGEDALAYLDATARSGVRAAIEAGLAAGRNPVDTARSIRDIVGLGDTQATWVVNLRTELETGQLSDALRRQLVNGNLERTIASRIKSGTPLKPAEIDKIVAGYANKMRAFHAETIARTMTLDLLRHGQIAAMRAAIARGEYAGLRVLKTWITNVDGRERDSHRELNGNEIPLDATWDDVISPTETVARDVPGGWSCRCAMAMRAVPMATP